MERFPADATTMNALFDALGHVVIALAASMPQAQKKAFADQLAAAANSAERNGQATLETTLIDLYRAASK